jgi:hypothetical protein
MLRVTETPAEGTAPNAYDVREGELVSAVLERMRAAQERDSDGCRVDDRR